MQTVKAPPLRRDDLRAQSQQAHSAQSAAELDKLRPAAKSLVEAVPQALPPRAKPAMPVRAAPRSQKLAAFEDPGMGSGKA